MKTTIIHHSADFDGIFCREIAHKFLPDAEIIGWDFKDPKIPFPDGHVYVLDLSPDCFIESSYNPDTLKERLIWIDHHKSSIEKWPSDLAGYRIDGVAACRLAWQWFTVIENHKDEDLAENWRKLPLKGEFTCRTIDEPLAVRLAGEYDIWDKRDSRAELFQHGLRSRDLGPNTWDILLSGPTVPEGEKQGLAEIYVDTLLNAGEAIQYAKTQENADIITNFGFTIGCGNVSAENVLPVPPYPCMARRICGTSVSLSRVIDPGGEYSDIVFVKLRLFLVLIQLKWSR